VDSQEISAKEAKDCYDMSKTAVELKAVDLFLSTDKIPTAILEEIKKLVR